MRRTTLLATLICCAAAAGCKHEEILYARATKLPEETQGFMRIATEDPIRVTVVGTDVVAERPLAGYCVIHESDLSTLVKNTQALLDLRASTRPSR